ncbi:MAG: hypothetical protein M1835_007541 [Candelina submexicana]|nr:MAG: hypothetical protein M1835_007541 [Candelina submexicana]
MAAQFAQLALKGAEPLIQNYDVIYEKGRDTVKKIPVPGRNASRREKDRYYQATGFEDYNQSRSRDYSRDRDQWDGYRNSQGNRYSEEYGRSRYNEVEEIPRDFPPPQGNGRAKSVDRHGSQKGGERSGRQPRQRYRRDSSSSSDSESSISPRRRFREDKDERMSKYTPAQDPSRRSTIATSSAITSKQNNDDNSSSESSDVISSSEDERQQKKARGKEMLTAGLAAVATVHAASGVYSSMEARDKRYEQVKSGQLSPEEARKQKTKALLQDFAAVGVAALSIKGAYAKWEGARAQHKQHQELKEAKRQRHEKRLRKMEKQMKKQQQQNQGNGKSSSNARPSYNRGYSTSAPDLTQMNRQPSGPPRYQDGNPYSAYRGR